MKQQLLCETNSKSVVSHQTKLVVGVCLAVVMGFLSQASLTYAQLLSPSPVSEVIEQATNSAVPVVPYHQQLAELALTYRGQLEEYRTKEQQYTVARTDFLQLQTLASLEKLFVAIREVTISRDQVLVTYLQQLRITLVATPGIEVDTKERALLKLEELIEVIELHQQVAVQAQDRNQIQELTDSFELIAPEFQTTVYFSLSLIGYGQIQSVTDLTQAIYQDLVEVDVAQLSPAVRDRRQRSLQEIATQFELADQQFNLIYQQIIKDELMSDDGTYRQVKEALNQSYAQVTRIQNFLDEVI